MIDSKTRKLGVAIKAREIAEEKEAVEDDLKPVFREDTYSLLYMVPLGSAASLFAILSVIIQVGLVVILLLNLYDFGFTGKEPSKCKGCVLELSLSPFLTVRCTLRIHSLVACFGHCR